MSRYVVKFTKEGYLKYTSHLDLLRLFKRVLKKEDIILNYSHGFNPHPKMGFAQPLSLGYSSRGELIEIETRDVLEADVIAERLRHGLPKGISIINCVTLDSPVKSIAAVVDEAEYLVQFDLPYEDKYEDMLKAYLNQEKILALKKQKKTKKLVEIEFKDKIRNIQIMKGLPKLVMKMDLDCGSISNLSPELVIASFLKFTAIDLDRENVDVERLNIKFGKSLQF